MCQGVFPSAFNPCDCSSSDFLTHRPARSPPDQKKQEQRTTTFQNVAPADQKKIMKQQPHHHQCKSMAMNHSPFSASSLLAKWVATTALGHDDARQQAHLHDLQGKLSTANRTPSMSSAGESAQLDAPHLVHAFFFDST